MTQLIKFIFGWTIWIIVFTLSILFNLVTWNWKETEALDMEVVITQICGKSTWEIMIW
jgi:hypothetical protein